MIKLIALLLFHLMLHKALTRVHFTFGFRVRPNKKPQIPFNNWKIVKGDTIQVRTGSDKGIVGKVEKVYRKSNSVVVEGVNLIKKSFSKFIIMLRGLARKISH